MMTKRERFEKFLNNEPVDRVPIAFFHHFTEGNEWFHGLDDQAAFEKNIEGHRTAREKFDPDVVKVMNDTLMFMLVDMSDVKCSADLRNIKPPMPGSPFFEKSKELTKRALAFYADSDAPKYITSFSPYMILKTSIHGFKPVEGKPLLVQWLEDDPDSVVAALDIIADAVIALNKELLTECGAEAIYFSVNNQGTFIPEDLYVKYISASEKKVLAAANELSRYNMIHICGYHGLGNNLDLYKDYDVPIVNWAVHAEGVGMKEGKEFFGGRPICAGFAQDTTIYKGTYEEVEAEVFAYLDEVGQLGVMIGDDCTVPTDIDDTRFNWVIRACEKYAETH